MQASPFGSLENAFSNFIEKFALYSGKVAEEGKVEKQYSFIDFGQRTWAPLFDKK